MKNLNEKIGNEIQGNKVQNNQKSSYEPPKITFVPLKIEERLFSCRKKNFGCTSTS